MRRLSDSERCSQGFGRFRRNIVRVTRDSMFNAGGNKRTLNVREKNGPALFIGKARCARCQNGPNFTDNKFQEHWHRQCRRSRKVFSHAPGSRSRRLQDAEPAQCGIASAVYARRLRTLHAVIDYYDRGGDHRAGQSPLVMKIGLTEGEKHRDGQIQPAKVIGLVRTLATRPPSQEEMRWQVYRDQGDYQVAQHI